MDVNSIFFSKGSLATGSKEMLCDKRLKQLVMTRIAYLLFFCYALMLIRPAVPVFTDMLAHAFWQQQHLMTVHEEHGKFHIHYDVQKQSQEHNSKGSPVQNTKYSDDQCLCAYSIIIRIAQNACSLESTFTTYKCFYPVPYQDKEYLPPRA